jgi:hypothetical protein
MYFNTGITCYAKQYKIEVVKGADLVGNETWNSHVTFTANDLAYMEYGQGGSNHQINELSANYTINECTYVNSIWQTTETVFFSLLSPLQRVAPSLQMNLALHQVLSLLTILIPLVVGFLGLRKALVILQQILKQA